MGSPIMNNPAMTDAARFSEVMKTDQKEATEDAKQATAQQLESKESLEADKTDESEMQATLKRAETIKKGPQKTEKAQRIGLSAIARQDSDELANNFSKKNKEYHLDEDRLRKIADSFDEFYASSNEFEETLRKSGMPEQEITKQLNQRIIEFVTGNKFPLEKDATPETRTQTGQNTKTFEYLIYLTDHKIEGMKSSTEKVPASSLKATEDFKPKILAAKDAYYAVNKTKVDEFQKLVKLGNILVQDLEPHVAAGIFGEKIDKLADMIHNPPDFQSFFGNYTANDEVDVNKVYDDAEEVLKKIGPNIKKANLDRGEIHNLVKTIRICQSAIHLCKNADKQTNQMRRMGIELRT